MKRYLIILLSAFCFIICCGFESPKQKVYDNADLLTKQEEKELQNKCTEVMNKVKSDIVIVTADSLDGKSAEAYADDFFDYNGFGFEEPEGTGVILLVSMTEREIWISTSGKCQKNLPDDAMGEIIDEISPYLTDESYYEAFSIYLSRAEEYIKNGGISNKRRAVDICIQLVGALIIALVAVGIMYSGNKSKMTVSGRTYSQGHKENILRHHDVFIRTTTITRHIDTTNSSRGGGSGGTHISSSGNSHGGRGGSF